MNESDIQCIELGSEFNLELLVFVKPGTYGGDVQHVGAAINHGLGHQALDGDLQVNDNDGTMIAYRVPDLSGTEGTFLLGEKSFQLDRGTCFLLTPDYEAEQLPFTNKNDALAHLRQS